MADLAIVGGVNVVGSFAAGGRAVVATETGADHFVVIDCAGRHGCPRNGARLMARGATVRGVQVIGGLAGKQGIVMAADTATNYLAMIDIGRRYR